MKHKDFVYIKHIRDAIELILDYTKDLDREEFNSNKITQDAVIRRIEVIGEAAKNLSMEFTERYPRVLWKQIIGMRDKLIHGYFNVDIDKVWVVIIKDIPILKNQIENILKSEE